MDFQPLFRRFDEKIKLHRYQENKELVERGQVVLDHIRQNIAVPHSFDFFWQGSYAIGTGTQPVNGDYDIDIGVEFNVRHDEHNPVTVKRWVYNAVKNLKSDGQLQPDVRWRGPCITVYYQRANEPKYHVDLAVMVKERYGRGVCLARGRENEQGQWERDDRRGFVESLDRRFTGSDGEQFRRVIRYLKRWKDVQFPPEGVWAPSGFALTIAASNWFRPAKASWYHDVTYDDLEATRLLVQRIHGEFRQHWDGQNRRYAHSLPLQFSYAPQDDVMAKMVPEQHQQLFQRLEQLVQWLDEARRTGTTAPLRKAFGNDFPEK